MKLTGVELRRVRMPLVAPFRTSFGVELCRDVLLVRAVTDVGEGWGECVATSGPRYSSEYVDAAADVLTRFFVPALAAHRRLDANAVGPALSAFHGHRMAKAAIEMAILDAEPVRAVRERFGADVPLQVDANTAYTLDVSASDRFYRTDITAPFVLDDGHLPVPTGPGIGVDPVADALAAVTTGTEWLPA